jgi:hypothetical protein
MSPSGNMHGMPLGFVSGIADYTTVPGMDWLKDVPRLNPTKQVQLHAAVAEKFPPDIPRRFSTFHCRQKHEIKYPTPFLSLCSSWSTLVCVTSTQASAKSSSSMILRPSPCTMSTSMALARYALKAVSFHLAI